FSCSYLWWIHFTFVMAVTGNRFGEYGQRFLGAFFAKHEHSRVGRSRPKHRRDAGIFCEVGGGAERENRLGVPVLVFQELERLPGVPEHLCSRLSIRDGDGVEQ